MDIGSYYTVQWEKMRLLNRRSHYYLISTGQKGNKREKKERKRRERKKREEIKHICA